MISQLHPRHDHSGHERRLIHQMMGPNNHFAMMQYNNQLRMQQAIIAHQNWQMQLQMLYGNNYTGMQAQQFTAGQRRQRVDSPVWRGGTTIGVPPGNGGMRAYPRSLAGHQQDMEGGPRQYPRTRSERLGQNAVQQANDAGYQPYRRNRAAPIADQDHLTQFGRRPDEPAPPARPRRTRGRSQDNLPPPRTRYVEPEEHYTSIQQPQQQKYQSEHQLVTGDILAHNPETGQSDISRYYRGTRFWEQGRPRALEQAGVNPRIRELINHIRTRADLAPNSQERMKVLYVAHLMEDVALFLNRAPRPSDAQISARVDHLVREMRATGIDALEGVIAILSVAGRGTFDRGIDVQNNGQIIISDDWTVTTPGGMVLLDSRVLHAQRDSGPGSSSTSGSGAGGVNNAGGGNATPNYTSAGNKQQYEKNRKSVTEQGRKKTNADSPTSIKTGNENLKKSQDALAKLNTSLQELQKDETTRKNRSVETNKQLAALEAEEKGFEKQIQQLQKDREQLNVDGKTLQDRLAELDDPVRRKAELEKLQKDFPVGGDPLLKALQDFQNKREAQQKQILLDVGIMKNSAQKLENSLTIAETRMEQIRTQTGQLRIQITKAEKEVSETLAKVTALRKQQEDLKKNIDAMEKTQQARKKTSSV